MARKKAAPKKAARKCARCKAPALYRVTDLVLSKKHKPAPYDACPIHARKALNLAGKMVERLPS